MHCDCEIDAIRGGKSQGSHATTLTFGARRRIAVTDQPKDMTALIALQPQLVKRQDRCDDGSISTTYYLELTEDQYKALGGE
jgi:hypothetical protein